jgi:hypothetical protein
MYRCSSIDVSILICMRFSFVIIFILFLAHSQNNDLCVTGIFWLCCVCDHPNRMSFVGPVIKHMAGKEIRLRLNIQSGGKPEVSRVFDSYGLSTDHADAVFATELDHQRAAALWMSHCRSIEEMRGN